MPVLFDFPSGSSRLHVICERDVGLFSLIQQVIAHIPWTIQENRVPVAYYQARTCYWTPNGYQDRQTVWEYYFEPIVPTHPTSIIPQHIRSIISLNHPSAFEVGYFADEKTHVSAHFGDHPDLKGKTLFIPYLLDDPEDTLRQKASAMITDFVRPRAYIQEKVDRFFRDHMNGRYIIGVHVRGTDAVSKEEIRPHRQGSLQLPKYVEQIERLLKIQTDATIFVASDAQSSVDFIKKVFGSRVIAYDSVRHQDGEAVGKGPTGWIMPAYIAHDRDQAARNGEEAVIEYLLLARCNYLVHNGSSIARTALLKSPEMPHANTHGGQRVGCEDKEDDSGRRLLLSQVPELDEQRVVTAIDPELIERVKAAKVLKQSSPLQYHDRSRVAFVIHSFNRAANIDQLVSGLRRIDGHELIVCDDGSLDDSRQKWMSHLVQPNDFLILSNDIHEIRILDRAIRFASADIICLVQDDDIIPHETGWLDCALEEFKKHPNLAIIGGFMGFNSFGQNPIRSRNSAVWEDAPFQFIAHVNIGPYFIRKQHFEALGGWDFSFSRVGEPGICFDSELCLRAWVNGYQVGYRFVPFKGPPKHYSLDGGTMLFSKEVRFHNQWRNQRKTSEMYKEHAPRIAELVRQANLSIGLVVDSTIIEPIGVLFLMNAIKTGGDEAQLAILARYLDRNRLRMSVLTCWEADESAPAFKKIIALNIPIDRTCLEISDEEDKIRYIINKIRLDKIRVVVACQDPRLAYTVFNYLSPEECRLIEFGSFLEEAAIIPKKHTARYVSASKTIRNEAAKLMKRPENSISIPCMVDTEEFDRFDRHTLRKAYCFSDDTCVVVFFGWLDSKTRVESLIQAAREIQTDCPEAHFLIVGGHDAFQSDYTHRIIHEARDLVETNHLTFSGLGGEEPQILLASDILVLPSVGDGTAHVLSEAGAAGLAVIAAADDREEKEKLDGAKGARIITPGRVDQLTQAIRDLIKNRALRESLGKHLKEKIRSEYSAHVVINQWQSLLADVANETIPSPHLRIAREDEILP